MLAEILRKRRLARHNARVDEVIRRRKEASRRINRLVIFPRHHGTAKPYGDLLMSRQRVRRANPASLIQGVLVGLVLTIIIASAVALIWKGVSHAAEMDAAHQEAFSSYGTASDWARR